MKIKPKKKVKIDYEKEVPDSYRTSNIKSAKDLKKEMDRSFYNSCVLRQQFTYLNEEEIDRLRQISKNDGPETEEKFNKTMENARGIREYDKSRWKLFQMLKMAFPQLLRLLYGGGVFFISMKEEDFFENDEIITKLAKLPQSSKDSIKKEIETREEGSGALFDKVIEENQRLNNPTASNQAQSTISIQLGPLSNTSSNNSSKKQLQIVKVESTLNEELINNFNKTYSNKPEYPDYKEPTIDENGLVTLRFPEGADQKSFFEKQAKANMPFVCVDSKTGEVTALSIGDGKLYKPDGTEFKENEKLVPTGVKYDADYKLPDVLCSDEPESSNNNVGYN